MTGTAKTIEGGEGSHHVIGHTPKHSVEVNVRIKKAKGGQTPAPPISSSTPDPEAQRAKNGTLRQGSWADILNQSTSKIHASKHLKNSTRLPEPEKPLDLGHQGKGISGKGIGIGTQTDAVDEVDEMVQSSRVKEDYITTIKQLHHLSMKLKEEVNRARMAKEQMASHLLGIIEEKDKIIKAFQEQPPRPLPVSTFTQHDSPPEEGGATRAEVNRYRSLIRDMRSLCQDEIEAMKHRRVFPPPMVVNGGGDGRGMLDSRDSSSENGGHDEEESQSGSTPSSGSNGVGEKEPDNNSTQYLDLPKK